MAKNRTQEVGRYPEFAERFRKALEAAGLVIGEDNYIKIGKVFGVSGASVGNWVNGDKMPSMARAIRIAKSLNISVLWLLQGVGEMRLVEHDDPEVVEAAQIMERIQPDKRAEGLSYLKWLESQSKQEKTP